MSTWETVNAENLIRNVSSGVYYLNAKVRGKKIRRSLKVKALGVAKIKRDELLLELRKKSVTNSDQVSCLDEALQIAIARHANKPGIKDSTKHFWQQIGDSLQKTFPLDIAPKNLTTDHLRLWWSKHNDHYKAQRANSALAMVRTLCEILVETGVKTENLADALKRVKVNKSHIEVLSREQIETLITSVRVQGKRASVESANFITLLAFSGMRLGEAQALQWEDIKENTITIRGGETGTKNHEVRQIPIISRLQTLIDTMRTDDSSGKVFHIVTPRIALDNACERLGYPHQRIHNLRHFFATMCIEQGTEIPTVAKWLGHKDGGITAMKVYGHLRDEHSLAQAAKIE